MTPQTKPTRANALIIFGAFVFINVLLLVFVGMKTEQVSPLAIIMSALSSVGCVYWSARKLVLTDQVGMFQANMLCCLAFAELVMLFGTFTGPGPDGPLPFAIVSWGLQFTQVLPKLLRYAWL